ncbi:MAG: hypothetical protein AUK63_456 [bacterium P3]|nr:MAG: hypothetical protein AUK63_456 [bacterium P3]KWW41912.1 MAG: hypothetical protein F083_563 [bacterium F083]
MKIRLLILLPLCVWLTACSGGDTTAPEVDPSIIKNPHSAAGYDESLPMPRIVFDKQQHDFGRLTANESISYSFRFRNAGNADLVISRCEASCGCTVADYPRHRIKPGEEGYVTITFSSAGKSGQQVQEVTVLSNSQPARTKLRVLAQVGR